MTETDATPVKGTKTHPYMSVIKIDPVAWAEFEATYDGRPEVKIRKLDNSEPDTWTVFVACASEAVKDWLEAGW